MSTGKPSMQVRLAAEREVSLFVIVLHSVLCLLIVVQALNIPLLWLLLPVTVFSFVLSWRQFVSRSGRGSIRTIYLDACDRVYVSVGNDVRRPAGIHSIHMYGGGILLCLSVGGHAAGSCRSNRAAFSVDRTNQAMEDTADTAFRRGEIVSGALL